MQSVHITGAQKLARIWDNSNFFWTELKKMGFEVFREADSPVIPKMLYNPTKIPAFSRECPNIIARFCISASHTREIMVHAWEVCLFTQISIT
ncbi:hypothetical protein V2J09_016952 [Rumex salicifolius]